MTDKTCESVQSDRADDVPTLTLSNLASMAAVRWRLIVGAFVAAALLGFAVAHLIPVWYTAKTVILPPQQQQSAAASAIAQLGALAGLAGGIASVKSPADQYVALMQSTTVSDRIIDQFSLQSVYKTDFRQQTRKQLKDVVRITVGKKDGMISVEVDDSDPQRAAAIANAYVDELRRMSNALAVSEAQQRRMFFEQQLAQTKERLAKAQVALEESGIGQGALKVEPKSAAESYARLRAQATAAEVKLQTLRRMLAENTPEVMQQQAALSALREQVARAEQQNQAKGGSDYVDKYREFKYQEALFDIFVKQFELAKVDESREGALIQVVDVAQPPELRSGPRRVRITAVAALVGLLAACAYVVGQGLRAGRDDWPASA
ncbi:MAG TPA: Wzz/FepE/Etk N-terminal domain-containing protein [Piscinibacter sp.]|uniref:Wzz/FepE/Etk N-terminal domain-containing protein n=1 Tax=Piscinibacter sp. TaxID=1903157 RepID=UPI002C95780B|nr:Wzz/FepE/Etk N-terminal domain-containing protein [Piscinibacter sp.]HNK16772.1 Wzz/FepE/Etk N-terminal domain-containing protein [Piscinibacter sp.]